METVIAQRIKNSRIHKGLSLQEVADRIGVSKQMVNKYEQGKSVPGSEKIILLSKLFHQKPDYFFRKSEVELGTISFRKKSSLGVKKINALKEEIRICIENYLFIENILSIENNFKNPLANFVISNEESIKDAADHLKEKWEIGKDALHNIIELLEEKMIKVIEVDDESGKFDGLATVIDGKYHIIVVNKNYPVERKRFTLLHELGHILLNLKSYDEKMQENFCNLFASEMLLSSANLILEFGSYRNSITFGETANVQKKYGISFNAIVYKLQQNNILSKSRTASYFKKINFDSKLKNFVNASRYAGVEYSDRYENLVLHAVAEELISVSKAAALLNRKISELKQNINLYIG